jgi:ATP-binding cassette subfamily C protein
MRLLVTLSRRYPARTAVMLACLLFAALAEGVGLTTMLPLLGLIAPASGGAAPPGGDSDMERRVRAVLDAVGLAPTLGALVLVVIGAMVVKAALVLLAQRQVGYTVAHVATDLRLTLLRALLATRWEYYVRQPIGQLANAYATEAFRASQAYLYGTMIISLAIQALVYAGVAIAVSWQVTIGAAVIGGTSFWMLNYFVRWSRRSGLRETRLLKSVLGRLTDVLYAVKPLKAMSRQSMVGPLLEKETQKLNKALRRDVMAKEALAALQEPLLVATIAGGVYVALSAWRLALDHVLLLAVLFARLLGHLNRIQKQLQRMANSESAFWSIRETIRECEAVREISSGTQPATLTRDIVLDGVTLSYGERDVLSGVSLTVPARRVTVLVGSSGAGKTSVVDLVTGLVRARAGEVRVDGVALERIDLESWRRRIGYVPQETLLLHDSVRINVTLGDPSMSEADVEAALRAAGAWEFVRVLPEGMDTPVGERGTRLSGGQRQRIAIARALVHRPLLLVLDEATANLDPESASAITATMRTLSDEITILAVSHQLTLLESADVVYRIEGGRATPIAPSAARAGARG